jgi:hypothetical protein
MARGDFDNLCDRLRSFETMTWDQIARSGSHFVDVDALIGDAQRRLIELRLDDLDQLFSLRLSARTRLWGIVRDDVFDALWWDPQHQICPSEKKHT